MPLSVVLAVGSDPQLLASRILVLQSAGYMVVSASTVEESVNRFKAGDFDLVILCHSIPAKDREGLTGIIRASGSLTPVVSIAEHSAQRDAFANATLDGDPNKFLTGIRNVLSKAARGPVTEMTGTGNQGEAGPHNESGAIEEVFVHESEELRWLSAIILGEERHIEERIVEATRLAKDGQYFFREWLKHWAQRATVRAALETVRPEIQKNAENGTHADGGNTAVPVLDTAKKRALRLIAIERIGADCDAFERAALVLHGYLEFSAQDCGLLLGCQPSAIQKAYSSAYSKVFVKSSLVESISEDLHACDE